MTKSCVGFRGTSLLLLVVVAGGSAPDQIMAQIRVPDGGGKTIFSSRTGTSGSVEYGAPGLSAGPLGRIFRNRNYQGSVANYRAVQVRVRILSVREMDALLLAGSENAGNGLPLSNTIDPYRSGNGVPVSSYRGRSRSGNGVPVSNFRDRMGNGVRLPPRPERGGREVPVRQMVESHRAGNGVPVPAKYYRYRYR